MLIPISVQILCLFNDTLLHCTGYTANSELERMIRQQSNQASQISRNGNHYSVVVLVSIWSIKYMTEFKKILG
jgi:hypothetical protein